MFAYRFEYDAKQLMGKVMICFVLLSMCRNSRGRFASFATERASAGVDSPVALK